jgi:hypothetical protein
MEKWKSDLDALINEAMSFVDAVRAGSVSRALDIRAPVPEQSAAIAVRSTPVTAGDAEPGKNSERDEITRRVASFKAHQERWIRERQDYANSILKGIAR